MAATTNVTVPNDGQWHEVGNSAKVRIIENRQPMAQVEFVLSTAGATPPNDLVGHTLAASSFSKPGTDSRESFAVGAAVFVRHRWNHDVMLVVSEL